MSLIKEYIGSMAGAQIFDIIAMIIFIAVFIILIIHTYSLKKEDIREYSRLPLEESEADQNKD